MKQLLLTLMMMVAALSGKAQMCITSPFQSSNPQNEPLDQVEPGYLLGNDCGSVFVKIKYHILTDGTSSTFFANQKARLNLGKSKAEQTFLEHNIFLHNASVDSFYIDPILLSGLSASPAPQSFIVWNSIFTAWFLPLADLESDYLHVFIGPSTGTAFGWAPPYHNFLYLQGESPYGNSLENHTLGHEIGHSLGLLHTFQTWGNPALTDTFGTDCQIKGDLVCDTPPDFVISGISPMSMVDATCNYIGSSIVPVGILYSPLTNNVMSYYIGCHESFTNGQGERARKAMEHGVSKLDNSINYSFAFAGVKHNVEDLHFNANFEIPQGKKLYMNRNIVVNSGSILTVHGKLLMGADKFIIVYPGGKLIVDGGEINIFDNDPTNPCLNNQNVDYWGGIIALGNSNANQLESNQGTVILSNAKIAKSKSGVGSGLTFRYNSIFNWPFPLVVAGEASLRLPIRLSKTTSLQFAWGNTMRTGANHNF